MKMPGLLVCTVMAIAGLALQGCATTSDTGSNAATRSAGAPVAATLPVPATPGAAVPQENGKPVVKADTKDDFEAIVAAIHQQMQPGGRWQYMDNSERTTLDSSFADMQKLYDQYGSVDKMDTTAKVRLLADQSTVNALLTRKDGERLICRSELPVGSHLPVKTCRTYAQIQAEQNNAQEFLRNHAETMQRKTGD